MCACFSEACREHAAASLLTELTAVFILLTLSLSLLMTWPSCADSWLCLTQDGSTLVRVRIPDEIKHLSSPHSTGRHYIWATGLFLRTSGHNVEKMEDFWAGALWTMKIWLYLIIGLIMIPAMFGFSLGISETYMTILVKTLEVLLFHYVPGRLSISIYHHLDIRQ